ncbi:MAG: hypothetical protein V3W26_00900, partial [Thermodesulfobacteriota bacterium]
GKRLEANSVRGWRREVGGFKPHTSSLAPQTIPPPTSNLRPLAKSIEPGTVSLTYRGGDNGIHIEGCRYPDVRQC